MNTCQLHFKLVLLLVIGMSVVFKIIPHGSQVMGKIQNGKNGRSLDKSEINKNKLNL